MYHYILLLLLPFLFKREAEWSNSSPCNLSKIPYVSSKLSIICVFHHGAGERQLGIFYLIISTLYGLPSLSPLCHFGTAVPSPLQEEEFCLFLKHVKNLYFLSLS